MNKSTTGAGTLPASRVLARVSRAGSEDAVSVFALVVVISMYGLVVGLGYSGKTLASFDDEVALSAVLLVSLTLEQKFPSLWQVMQVELVKKGIAFVEVIRRVAVRMDHTSITSRVIFKLVGLGAK